MKDYFQLQFKILNRKIIAFGLPLLIGYTLIPLLFFFLSNYLFEKTEFASYIFIFIATGFVSKLSDSKRNDFLKTIFNKKNFLILRIIENIIYSLPFILFLAYKGLFIPLLLVCFLSISIVLINLNVNLNYAIPTPFSKKPFEFVVGFRNTFFIFPIAYFLTYISISVENFNLGIFSMILIGITCLSYYSKVENEYFVWNFSKSPKEFLLEKLKICLTYFLLITLPILIALGIFFFNDIDLLIVFFLLCHVYLVTMVFAKYSAFPNEMNVSQVILIAGSFIFPPILVVVISLFYSQSIKRLNAILND